MKRNSKIKILALMMVVCFAFSFVLAGCGEKNNTTSGDETSTTEPTVTTEPSTSGDATVATTGKDWSKEKEVELKWYFVGNGPQKEVADIETKVNEIIKPKLNATIKLICFDWGTYDQKMQAKITSGEEFDICFTANWTNNYGQNVSKGSFVDLTPIMDTYAPETKKLLGDKVIKGASIGGKLYAIPANKEMAHNWVLCLKKDLVDKYKFDVSTIKKLEDLKPMLQTIKEKEPGVYPFEALQGESPYRVLDFEKMVDDNAPGAVYGDYRDTKVVNDFDTPESKAFYDLMRDFYKSGFIRKDADTVQDYAADEKAGKIFAHVKSGKPGKAAELSLAQGVEWIQVDLTAPVATTREMTGSMQAISVSSKNPERALAFLELFNTDKALNNLINFGVENTHFVKKGDNIIEFPADSDGGKKLGYNPGTPWMFGNQFLNFLFTTEDPEKWTKFKEFNDKATGSPLLGFTFDVNPVKSEVAALSNAKKQYFPSLETGKASDTAGTLAKMNQKFKDSGLEKVLAEMQKQVDAFLATSK